MNLIRLPIVIVSIFCFSILTSCSNSLKVTSTLNFKKPTPPPARVYSSSNKPTFISDVEISGGQNDISLNIIEQQEEIIAQYEIPDFLLVKYSQLLQVDSNLISNYTLYRFIDDWYGVRYRYGGTDRSGIDCSAFTQKLYDRIYCTELLRTAYSQYKSCDIVRDKDMVKEGDLVFFRTRGRAISHVGIYLANNYFVHASTSSGIMISSLNDRYWSKRYAGAGKINKADM